LIGDWTLVGCTVAPGFEFAKFELAPKGWEPKSRSSLSEILPAVGRQGRAGEQAGIIGG
jgi:predicted cupin superfamily sugar epimerase